MCKTHCRSIQTLKVHNLASVSIMVSCAFNRIGRYWALKLSANRLNNFSFFFFGFDQRLETNFIRLGKAQMDLIFAICLPVNCPVL